MQNNKNINIASFEKIVPWLAKTETRNNNRFLKMHEHVAKTAQSWKEKCMQLNNSSVRRNIFCCYSCNQFLRSYFNDPQHNSQNISPFTRFPCSIVSELDKIHVYTLRQCCKALSCRSPWPRTGSRTLSDLNTSCGNRAAVGPQLEELCGRLGWHLAGRACPWWPLADADDELALEVREELEVLLLLLLPHHLQLVPKQRLKLFLQAEKDRHNWGFLAWPLISHMVFVDEKHHERRGFQPKL